MFWMFLIFWNVFWIWFFCTDLTLEEVIDMSKRHAISHGGSRKLFSKTAGTSHMHRKNVLSGPVARGGVRL